MFRVSCSSPDSFVPQLSGSGSFGPLSSVRRKKCLCQVENLSHKIRSVAISALSKGTVCFYEISHRDCARTEHKCYIMVKAIPLTKKEVPDPDDNMPDYSEIKDDAKDAWRLEDFDEIERNLRTVIKKRGVHPVDPIAITLKMHPIPVKDLPPNWIDIRTEAWYGEITSLMPS